MKDAILNSQYYINNDQNVFLPEFYVGERYGHPSFSFHVQVNSHKRRPKGAGAKFVFGVLYPSLPTWWAIQELAKDGFPIGLMLSRKKVYSQRSIITKWSFMFIQSCLGKYSYLNWTNRQANQHFSVGLWLSTSCDSISFLAVIFMFWNGEKDDKWLSIRSLLSYLRNLGWRFDHEMISL